MRWTKRFPKSERAKIAYDVKAHRTQQYLCHSLMYSAARRLADVSKNIDVEQIVRERMARLKRPLRFFDSGGGNAGVSSDLKRVFGSQIEVTALSLRHPNISKKSEKAALKDVKKFPKAYYPYTSMDDLVEIGKALAKDHAKVIKDARVDTKLIDHQKVGLIENFPTTKKYDVIFDYTGPLKYSAHRERVVQQYRALLPKGGLLIALIGDASVQAFFEKKQFKIIRQGKNFAVLEKI